VVLLKKRDLIRGETKMDFLGAVGKDKIDEQVNSMPASDNQVGQANIKVFGVGGAGSNMISWLYKKGIKGAKIIAANTDIQHLDMVSADHKILIGKSITRGLGCGGFPEKGAESAKESILEVRESIKNADMVFVCAGMGGGTGTGAAPVIASVAKQSNAIVIGTVTMPFNIERARIERAELGLDQLRDVCDTVIVIDNNRLVNIAGNLPVQQAFAVANELISTMIRGIVETISVPSLVNLDFADVKAIMSKGGVAVIGVGFSDTTQKVEEAAKGALSNPLLDVQYSGADGALIHIEGGPDMTLEEVSQAGDIITENLDDDANVIWGARIREDMKGKICVMTIITGVKSPCILGKKLDTATSVKDELSEELGIDVL